MNLDCVQLIKIALLFQSVVLTDMVKTMTSQMTSVFLLLDQNDLWLLRLVQTSCKSAVTSDWLSPLQEK